MKIRWVVMMAVVCVLLAGCGVPREALEQARVEVAASKVLPGDEAGVREALRQQAVRWEEFAQTLRRREWGGVMWVDEGFVALVERTAAVAKRQVALMEAGEDKVEVNRAVLEEMAGLWAEAERYLGQ